MLNTQPAAPKRDPSNTKSRFIPQTTYVQTDTNRLAFSPTFVFNPPLFYLLRVPPGCLRTAASVFTATSRPASGRRIGGVGRNTIRSLDCEARGGWKDEVPPSSASSLSDSSFLTETDYTCWPAGSLRSAGRGPTLMSSSLHQHGATRHLGTKKPGIYVDDAAVKSKSFHF